MKKDEARRLAQECLGYGLEPEQLEQWVGVLRTYGYRHGKGRLRTAEGAFCCLGVLGDHMGRKSESMLRLVTFVWLWGARDEVVPCFTQNAMAEINDRGQTKSFAPTSSAILKIADQMRQIAAEEKVKEDARGRACQ